LPALFSQNRRVPQSSLPSTRFTRFNDIPFAQADTPSTRFNDIPFKQVGTLSTRFNDIPFSQAFYYSPS